MNSQLPPRLGLRPFHIFKKKWDKVGFFETKSIYKKAFKKITNTDMKKYQDYHPEKIDIERYICYTIFNFIERRHASCLKHQKH